MKKPIAKKILLIAVFLVIASISKFYDQDNPSQKSEKVTTNTHTEKISRNVKIVTWNAKDLKSLSDVEDRKYDLKQFGDKINPDILILQEVSSRNVVEKIKIEMGLNNYAVEISDFLQPRAGEDDPFEVAFISKFPFSKVTEYDTTLDNGSEATNENELYPLRHLGIKDRKPGRGFLWAQIDSLKLTIIGLHLKSSRGKVGYSDKDNAEKREIVASSAAMVVNSYLRTLKGYVHLVAGDFNIGHSDRRKNGTDLNEDCYKNCSGKDGYDETHAFFRDGLIDELKMRNLTGGIQDATFPKYPGSPIDNIYVAGLNSNSFSPAEKGTDTFGSDHLPVWTNYKLP